MDDQAIVRVRRVSRRVTSFLKSLTSPLNSKSYDIILTSHDNSPPRAKLKRNTILLSYGENASSGYVGTPSTESHRYSLNEWRRRRFSRREDDVRLTKATGPMRTAQASRQSRYQMLNLPSSDEVR